MAEVVLDCSVTAAWCFEDEAAGYADRVLETLRSSEALVPQLWLLELGNVLVVAERRGRLRETCRTTGVPVFEGESCGED